MRPPVLRPKQPRPAPKPAPSKNVPPKPIQKPQTQIEQPPRHIEQSPRQIDTPKQINAPTQIEQPPRQIEQQPQPGTSGASTKRKLTEDPANVPKKRSKYWFEEGDRSVPGVIYIRVEKVPGQKRLQSTMTADEKLNIAVENQDIRNRDLDKANKMMNPIGMTVMLNGKNLNLGITNQKGTFEFTEEQVKAVRNYGRPEQPNIPKWKGLINIYYKDTMFEYTMYEEHEPEVYMHTIKTEHFTKYAKMAKEFPLKIPPTQAYIRSSAE